MTGPAGRRVVVTGCGVVSPLGQTTDDFWSALVAGRSGVGPITGFDASDLPVRIAGEVRDFDPTRYLPRTVRRRLDQYAQYAVVAGAEAVEAAKLVVDPDRADRIGVLVGSAYGPGHLIQRNLVTLAERGPRAVSPHYAAVAAADNGAGEIAMRLGARGPSGSLTTACATGASCIGEAARQIRHGYADAMVAGGADDPITRLDLAAAANAGALSRRNDQPAQASRPFDRARDGFVFAAGAGVVVLEDAALAQQRGAPILAELAGYGATTDTHHLTAPDPDGLAASQAMRAALADAGCDPAEVDYVNAHATGTRQGDRAELTAIRAVFGERAGETPVTSMKSMTGHMIGAAGAAELIATVQVIRTGTVPPTINCDDPEQPELDHVPHQARPHPVRVALSNSFGFAGHNAVLVVRAWSAEGSGGVQSGGRR